MNREEKFQAIVKRANMEGKIELPEQLDCVLTISYLDQFREMGIIRGGEYSVSESGKILKSICEEFEWEPDDIAVKGFLKILEFENEEDKDKIFYLIKTYMNKN